MCIGSCILPIPCEGVVRGDVLGFMSLSSLEMCRNLIGSPTEGLQALTNPSLPYGPRGSVVEVQWGMVRRATPPVSLF